MSIVPVGGRWTLTVLHQHGKTLTIQVSEVHADQNYLLCILKCVHKIAIASYTFITFIVC